MMTELRSERRSLAVGNDAQTRPDQTRVLVTASCGVSISNSIHRQGSRATCQRDHQPARNATAATHTDRHAMDGLREIRGGW